MDVIDQSLRGIDESIQQVQEYINGADSGCVLFIGYTGMGKSTAISDMLIRNIAPTADGTKSKVC